MPTQCFMLEVTNHYRRHLRRYVYNRDQEKCPYIGSHGYHHAMNLLDELVLDDPKDENVCGDRYPHDKGPWPTHCPCGYQFQPQDEWQLFVQHLYSRSDTGELIDLREAPAGAMWYANWMIERRTKPEPGQTGTYFGPDGHCLVVKTPAGDWMVDGPSTNGNGWTRTGVPPLVTANPSIWVGCPETVPPKGYHGFLQNGTLTDPLT